MFVVRDHTILPKLRALQPGHALRAGACEILREEDHGVPGVTPGFRISMWGRAEQFGASIQDAYSALRAEYDEYWNDTGRRPRIEIHKL